MFSFKRWLKAQRYEQSFWEKAAESIVSGTTGQLNWYGWRAEILEKRIDKYIENRKKMSAKILEIGSGPVGIVSFLGWGERYAIDPLEDFYVKNPVLTRLRNPKVIYIKGIGESIPFNDAFFSLVIIDNVIDHTQDPFKVMKEINRILINEGILYISVNIHTRWGSKLHHILSTISIDKGHPHTFTIDKIQSLLRNNDLRIEEETIENYHEVRRKDRKSKSLKSKVKGYTGLSEFLYQAICKKD